MFTCYPSWRHNDIEIESQFWAQFSFKWKNEKFENRQKDIVQIFILYSQNEQLHSLKKNIYTKRK